MDFYEAQEHFTEGMLKIKYDGDLPLDCYVSLIPCAQAFYIIGQTQASISELDFNNSGLPEHDRFTVYAVLEKTLQTVFNLHKGEWDENDKNMFERFMHEKYSNHILPLSHNFKLRRDMEIREIKRLIPVFDNFGNETLYSALVLPHKQAKQVFLAQTSVIAMRERSELCDLFKVIL